MPWCIGVNCVVLMCYMHACVDSVVFMYKTNISRCIGVYCVWYVVIMSCVSCFVWFMKCIIMSAIMWFMLGIYGIFLWLWSNFIIFTKNQILFKIHQRWNADPDDSSVSQTIHRNLRNIIMASPLLTLSYDNKLLDPILSRSVIQPETRLTQFCTIDALFHLFWQFTCHAEGMICEIMYHPHGVIHLREGGSSNFGGLICRNFSIILVYGETKAHKNLWLW